MAINDSVRVNDKISAMSRDSLARLSCFRQKIPGYRLVTMGRPRTTSFFVQTCTAPQQALEVQTCLCPSGRIEKKSCRHLKVDKQSAPWRCRMETPPFSPDL